MVDRIEDLNLPNTVILRLIKDALTPHTNVSKEARTAIARAASIFVIFITTNSLNLTRQRNQKCITTNDIMEALKSQGLESLVEPLTEDLVLFREKMKNKRESKKNNSTTNTEEININEINIKTEGQSDIIEADQSDNSRSEDQPDNIKAEARSDNIKTENLSDDIKVEKPDTI